MPIKSQTLKDERKYKDACFILNQLETAGFQARLVGGCVRDRQLGVEPKDYDIASSADPDQILRVFRGSGFKLLSMGKEHGTIVVVMPSHPIEITTLRDDVENFGRKAKVAFHEDFKADAARRDFTVNALSEDVRGNIYDYFQGLEHLKSKQLMFVGEAKLRIQEDYLRILRFFRFKARYQLSSDASTLLAIKEHHAGLAHISLERITHEIKETFIHTPLKQILGEMYESGVLGLVFSGIEKLPKAKIESIMQRVDHIHSIPELSMARLGLLYLALHSEGMTKSSFRLKLSRKEELSLDRCVWGWENLKILGNDFASRLLFFDELERHLEPLSFSEFFFPIWQQWAVGSEWNKLLDEILKCEKQWGWRRKRPFPIDGAQIMKALNLTAGPKVGLYLHKLKVAFLNGEWESSEEALKLLKQRVEHEI